MARWSKQSQKHIEPTRFTNAQKTRMHAQHEQDGKRTQRAHRLARGLRPSFPVRVRVCF